MGIHRPGFQLLSLLPTSSEPSSFSGPTFADAPCFLPYQLGTYIFIYGPLAAFSILLLLSSHVYRAYVSSTRCSMPVVPQPQHLQTFPSSSSYDYDYDVRSSALRSSDLTSSSSSTLQVLRNYDAPDVTGEADFMLPPPSPTPGITAKSRRRNVRYFAGIPMVFRFTIGGRKMVADLSSVRDLLGCCGRARGQSRAGVLRGWVGDVWRVVWVAVGVFLLLAWWFS